MTSRTVITPAAGATPAEPARAEGRTAVSARVGMSAPSGRPPADGLAAGRRLAGVPGGRPVVLRDGSAVLIRPVRSTDAALLADGFARLSAASRQMRFLGVKKELTAAELRYFTDVDHHDHEALGALDPASGHGVGIARYVRDAGDPRAAEIGACIALRLHPLNRVRNRQALGLGRTGVATVIGHGSRFAPVSAGWSRLGRCRPGAVPPDRPRDYPCARAGRARGCGCGPRR